MRIKSKVGKSGNSLMVRVRAKDGFRVGQEVWVSHEPGSSVAAAQTAASAGKPDVVAADKTAAKDSPSSTEEEPEQSFIIKWQAAKSDPERSFLRLKAGHVWAPDVVERLIGIAEGRPAKLVF